MLSEKDAPSAHNTIDIIGHPELDKTFDAVLDIHTRLSMNETSLARSFSKKTFEGQLLDFVSFETLSNNPPKLKRILGRLGLSRMTGDFSTGSATEATEDHYRKGEYTIVDEPTAEDLERAEGLVEVFQGYADVALDQWDNGDLFRLIGVETEQGSMWVYNSKANIVLQDVSAWKLLEVDGNRYWQPDFAIEPQYDEDGALLPYADGAEVIVLPEPDERMSDLGYLRYLQAAESAAPNSMPAERLRNQHELVA